MRTRMALFTMFAMLFAGTAFSANIPKFDFRPMGGGVSVEAANATSQLMPATGVEILAPIGHGFSAAIFFTTAGGNRIEFRSQGQDLVPSQMHHHFGFGLEWGRKITVGAYILMGDLEPPPSSWAFGVFAPKFNTPIWGMNARFGLRLARSGYGSYSLKYLPTVSVGW